MQESPFATVDDSVWDEKYADRYGSLDFGISSEQGPREDMEDCAYVVPRARCGFLFAGEHIGHVTRVAVCQWYVLSDVMSQQVERLMTLCSLCSCF